MRFTFNNEITEWIETLESALVTNQIKIPRFIKPFHLVTLALVLKKHKKNVTLSNNTDLQKYAARMGLWDAIGCDAPCEIRKKNSKGRFLPIEPLTCYDKVSENIDKVTNIVQKHFNDKDTKDSFTIFVSEILENCYYHSQSDNGLFGLACCQPWANGGKAQIAVADIGIGIRKSLERNPKLIELLQQNNACQLATYYKISGNPEGTGYGLTLAHDLTRTSNAMLFIYSGDEFFYCDKYNDYQYKANLAWQGTIIVFEWNLNNSLSVKTVYDNWPIEEVPSDDDFTI